jgi:hypothetical protein
MTPMSGAESSRESVADHSELKEDEFLEMPLGAWLEIRVLVQPAPITSSSLWAAGSPSGRALAQGFRACASGTSLGALQHKAASNSRYLYLKRQTSPRFAVERDASPAIGAA